ncbi:hypothetical protein [Notoacmeibacter marinus]|uniref:hypothetical protein n=1 Tax=Notoacmeibacter marinus TaxID=1876515 RepID=UPI000DF1F5C1|nr:hypothetical protein [Notoacmeibacter marinus]
MAYEPNPDEMDDPAKLRTLIQNASRLGRDDLVLRCQMRLAKLAAPESDDELEHEFWQAVHMAEELRTAENGRTTRLSRTRQKHKRDGAKKCVADLATRSDFTEGFRILVDGGHPELTFESILLRHSDQFTAEEAEQVREKLGREGIKLDDPVG